MNQKSQQKAKNSVEKDFQKLLNNSSFHYDCRNNIGNYYFEPLSDRLEEISYLKKYQRVFDAEMSAFLNCDLAEQEIKNEFNQKLLKLKFDEY